MQDGPAVVGAAEAVDAITQGAEEAGVVAEVFGEGQEAACVAGAVVHHLPLAEDCPVLHPAHQVADLGAELMGEVRQPYCLHHQPHCCCQFPALQTSDLVAVVGTPIALHE